MSRVKIQIYHENNAARESKPARTIWIERNSDKKLTGKQARQILAEEFPRFVKSYGILLTKTSEGWRASRTIRPTAKCDYHYIWERAIIAEEESQ
jgi:hypothetical protein